MTAPLPSPSTVVPLSVSGTPSRAALTAKARSLQLLWSLGLKVPRAFAVVGSDSGSLRDQDLGEIARRLSTSLAIRSSAAAEDGDRTAQAGRFLTLLDIPNNGADLRGAVIKVAASYEGLEGPSCVIVQDYIRPAFGGVVFASPGGEVLVEWSSDQTTVTGGTGASRHARLRRGEDAGISGLSPAIIHSLLGAIELLGQHFPTGVDLEWVVDDRDVVWFVQARAITAQLGERPTAADFVSDIDDLAVSSLSSDSKLRALVESFNVKRRWARLTARSSGVDYARTYVARASSVEVLRQQWATLEPSLRTRLVTLKLADDGRALSHAVVPTRDVFAALQNLEGASDCEMYVAEYFQPLISGLCSRQDDGTFLIEYAYGDIQALYSGDIAFSVCVASAEGHLLSESRASQTQRYTFDVASGKSRLEERGLSDDGVSPELLKAITRMTEVMTSRFGESRVEWLVDEAHVIMFDLSVESSRLPQSLSVDVRIVSDGRAQGHALVVNEEDLNKIRAVLKMNRSVVASAQESDALTSDDVVLVRDSILSRTSPQPVIVSEFPDLALAVFLDFAAGFIFTSGAILSHLAIILRESATPALITENARSLQTGDDVWISRSELTIDTSSRSAT